MIYFISGFVSHIVGFFSYRFSGQNSPMLVRVFAYFELGSILLVNFFGFLIVFSAKEVNHASVMVFSTIVS